MHLEALDLGVRLHQATTPTSKAFIGTPPDEIDSLVRDTLHDAQTLAKVAGKASDHNCAVVGRGVCYGLRGDVFKAMSPMGRELSGWRPYT